MKLAIVIPTYNEGKTLPSLIEKLVDQVKHIVDEFNIVIVDDSSPAVSYTHLTLPTICSV